LILNFVLGLYDTPLAQRDKADKEVKINETIRMGVGRVCNLNDN